MSTTTETQLSVQTQPAIVKKFEEGTLENVISKVSTFVSNGDIRLPANYSPENAIRSAFLMLQDQKTASGTPVLEACTKDSIANSMLKMVVQGMNPVKNQCYFIPYSNILSYQRSYFGAIALAKRVSNVADIKSKAIYEGDEFAFEMDMDTMRQRVVKHVQSMDSIDPDKVKGAYAVIFFEDGTRDLEVMTMKQIRTAWEQGATKGNSPAHKRFADEMSEKTVANRAAKIFINSSDDSDLMGEDQTPDLQAANVQAEINQNANKKQVGFAQPIQIETKKEQVKEAVPVAAAPVEEEKPTQTNKPDF